MSLRTDREAKQSRAKGASRDAAIQHSVQSTLCTVYVRTLWLVIVIVDRGLLGSFCLASCIIGKSCNRTRLMRVERALEGVTFWNHHCEAVRRPRQTLSLDGRFLQQWPRAGVQVFLGKPGMQGLGCQGC